MLATITVTSLADNLDMDGAVTLREAVHAAESDISVDSSTAGSGADTIEFAPGLSGAIDLSTVGDTAVGPSALLITSSITIQGNDNGITIRRDLSAGDMRLFRIAPAGDLTLETIMLTGGVARGANGAEPGTNGGEGRGGAIFNAGTLEIVASTLYENQARGGDGLNGNGGGGLGGAVYNDGGAIVVRNSTFSGNAVVSGAGLAPGSRFGGGIYGRNGELSIDHSTVTNGIGEAGVAGRGVYVLADGPGNTATLIINNSVIGHEGTTSPSEVVIISDNGANAVSSGSFNLIRVVVGFDGTYTTADPRLAALANNGGPTLTHAPLSNSPAIDLGDPTAMAGEGSVPQFDQRGAPYSRVSDGRIDIGAFEREAAVGPALLGDYNGDHTVDAADYLIWRKTFGAIVEMFEGADGSGNGMIDETDYGVWRLHFGEILAEAASITPPVVTIPSEPESIAQFAAVGAASVNLVAEPGNFERTDISVAPVGQRTGIATSSFTTAAPSHRAVSDLALLNFKLPTSSASSEVKVCQPADTFQLSGSTADSIDNQSSAHVLDDLWADWPEMIGFL